MGPWTSCSCRASFRTSSTFGKIRRWHGSCVASPPSQSSSSSTSAAPACQIGYPWGATPAQLEAAAERWQEKWGRVVFALERFAPSKVGDGRYREWFARLERLSASPGAAATLARMNGEIDVRHVLPSVSVPTLVLHRSGELVVSVHEGRYIAERIPGAKYVELDGVDHWPWLGDADAVIEEIRIPDRDARASGARPSSR